MDFSTYCSLLNMLSSHYISVNALLKIMIRRNHFLLETQAALGGVPASAYYIFSSCACVSVVNFWVV